MVPSCYTKNSRHGDLSLAVAIQRGEALRQEGPPRTTVRHSSRKPICNSVSSSWPGPRLQYKEQSNYSTAQGLAYRQLIPHTRMYEYTSLRAPILGSGRRLMCRINNRYPTSLLFGPVGKPPWHYHPHVATPLSQWHFESSRSPKERRLNKECKQYHLVIQPCHIMC